MYDSFGRVGANSGVARHASQDSRSTGSIGASAVEFIVAVFSPGLPLGGTGGA
ncbi:hypothetical protein [[Pseudopropionibacterium] massiliense]|uniref:hypothetical protein n=1 Tax=[Pseudopropionibacterium] massiliense TaxID=2220000 RepID=UPI0013EF2D7B|nr:hypothetical protein [[Pseudopropionibacterium] massiliense]